MRADSHRRSGLRAFELGRRLGEKFKMTLVGFLRGEICNFYAGAERIDA